ncbi:bifunctional aspartate transaminase/aspartate 4-decarboxylase [Streptomyces sp. NPDC048659]|uniref:bifunctional aspartate transaminase/aspartate 4-decarboxylase n=1 Tax=Streptomyces sp. NPDC048659 TaxID=3155489 RepID=UPI00342EF6FC
MTESSVSREEMRRLSKLSPFELKGELIALAARSGDENSRSMLNAGRGNPNWIATGPREAFFALGAFAIEESRRVWTADNLGGMPARSGVAERFRTFVQRNPGMAGIGLLERCVSYAVSALGFDADAWVHELVDGLIGDNYPVPDRILTHCQEVVRSYVAAEMYGSESPEGSFDVFATEGGTAAMCYIFDSLMVNKVLRKGDKIALLVPTFTPYIEIPHLERYGFEVVKVEANLFAEAGVREWRYPDAEIDKLADPSVKAVFVVNPSNPPSVEMSDHVRDRIVDIVKHHNRELIVVTDDVYGTFVDGFTSLVAAIPQNTLLVYSYSKHYGCTGWRLGVIALHQDNVIDRMIAALPAEERAALDERYGSLQLDPWNLKFIDRMVADSREVALNHTAGLSLPQQVQMMLFSLFDLLPEGQEYKKLIQSIVHRRLDLLLEGSGMKIADDPKRAAYYIELDILAEAEREQGKEFADYLEATYEPTDILFRLAEQTSVVLLNGGGFDGPEWSVRVSLANLDDLDYLKIGHSVREVLDGYLAEWRAVTPVGAWSE